MSLTLITAAALAGVQPAVPPANAATPPAAAARIKTDRAGVLALAERLSAARRYDVALAMLDALAPEDRAQLDVRFARAVLLIELKRPAEAEPILADLVAAQPGATRIRLEHGRALAALGRNGAAERQLRRALADSPPDGVVTTVYAAISAMRARQRLFGSLSAGLAPDSNINAATSAESIELYGLPFTLDSDARAKSGTGILASGEIGWRQPLRSDLSGVVRANGFARIYPKAKTDDISLEFRGGLEIGEADNRITPEVTWLRRWYAGSGYASALGAGVRVDRTISRSWQLSAIGDLRRISHDRNKALDGWATSLRLESSHALSSQSLLVLGATASRTTARDNGYASWLSEVDAAFYRDWKGGWSTGVSIAGSYLAGDETLKPFPSARRDWRLRGSATIANRKLAFMGLMPGLRIVHERMESPIPLYRYQRSRLELTFDRRF